MFDTFHRVINEIMVNMKGEKVLTNKTTIKKIKDLIEIEGEIETKKNEIVLSLWSDGEVSDEFIFKYFGNSGGQ